MKVLVCGRLRRARERSRNRSAVRRAAEIVKADWKPASERWTAFIKQRETNRVVVSLGEVDGAHVIERPTIDDADTPRCFNERRVNLGGDGRVANWFVGVGGHDDGFATDDEATPNFLNARACRPVVSSAPEAMRASAPGLRVARTASATASPP